MSVPNDRKMFAALRRAQMISPELKLVALLMRHQADATAEVLANDLASAEWWSGAGRRLSSASVSCSTISNGQVRSSGSLTGDIGDIGPFVRAGRPRHRAAAWSERRAR